MVMGCNHCLSCRFRDYTTAIAAACGAEQKDPESNPAAAGRPFTMPAMHPQPRHPVCALWEARECVRLRQRRRHYMRQVRELEERPRCSGQRGRSSSLPRCSGQRGRSSSLPRVLTSDGRRRHQRARTESPQPRTSFMDERGGISVVVYESRDPFTWGNVELICDVPYGTPTPLAREIARATLRQREERERQRRARAAAEAAEAEAARAARREAERAAAKAKAVAAAAAEEKEWGGFLSGIGLTLSLCPITKM